MRVRGFKPLTPDPDVRHHNCGLKLLHNVAMVRGGDEQCHWSRVFLNFTIDTFALSICCHLILGCLSLVCPPVVSTGSGFLLIEHQTTVVSYFRKCRCQYWGPLLLHDPISSADLIPRLSPGLQQVQPQHRGQGHRHHQLRQDGRHHQESSRGLKNLIAYKQFNKNHFKSVRTENQEL